MKACIKLLETSRLNDLFLVTLGDGDDGIDPLFSRIFKNDSESSKILGAFVVILKNLYGNQFRKNRKNRKNNK